MHANKDANKPDKPAQAKRPAESPASPEEPYCPHCNARDLMKGGKNNDRQRYRCRACGRTSYGAPLPVRFPCPNPGCNGSCRKHGRSELGKQLYWCNQCRRINTELWPTDPRFDGGPFPHKMTLDL